MLNPEIFKAYDIRGIYNTDFDDEVAYQMALAYVALRKTDIDYDASRPLKLAVGSDMRISSPALKEKLIAGFIAAGVDVFDFGLVSTPAFYFAVASYQLDGGIMISASHNPGGWNGFKVVRTRAVPVSGETGIAWMKDKILANDFSLSETPGTITVKYNIAQEQLLHDKDYLNLKSIKPF